VDDLCEKSGAIALVLSGHMAGWQPYQYILVDFLHKAYSKVDIGHIKISDAIFLSQSPLLSTTLLKNNKTANC